MPATFHCEYAGKAEGARYEQWREGFARRWLSADFEPIGDDRIANEVDATEHALVGLCHMRSTPVRISRRHDHDAPGMRYLILAPTSNIRVSQRGNAVDLVPGDMILLSGEEPALVAQLTAGDRWSIRLSQETLAGICSSVDDKLARPMQVDDTLANLVRHQVEVVHRFGPRLDAVANHAMAQHLVDLVSLCLGAGGDTAELARRRGVAAARLDAVKADILGRLAQADAGLATIAAAHGISTRYVQHLFELAGTSFTGFVLEQRLLRAYRFLRQPMNRRRKISTIAATVGFSDISYFNRAFKVRFGATPTDVRRADTEPSSPGLDPTRPRRS